VAGSPVTAERLAALPREQACVALIDHMKTCRDAMLWHARTPVAIHKDPQEALPASFDLLAMFDRDSAQHCQTDAVRRGHDVAVACYQQDCDGFAACVLKDLTSRFGAVERLASGDLSCPDGAQLIRGVAGGNEETLLCVEADGRPQGPFLRRHENGKKGFAATFVDGLLEGALQGWDPEGKQVLHFPATKGVAHGEAWTADGSTKIITHWNAGVKERIEVFEAGELVERQVRQGGEMVTEIPAPPQ